MALGDDSLQSVLQQMERQLRDASPSGATSAGVRDTVQSILRGEVRLLPVPSNDAASPAGQATPVEPSMVSGLGAIVRQFEALWGGGNAGSSPLGGLFGLGSARGGTQTTGTLGEQLLNRITGNLLGGPLGLLAGAFGSLFRNRRDPQVFETYDAPESLMFDLDIGSAGSRRTAPGGSGRDDIADTSPAAGTNATAPVVIQVNTMDARSFSDHRDDIAAAVREALTRSHSLRDELWED